MSTAVPESSRAGQASGICSGESTTATAASSMDPDSRWLGDEPPDVESSHADRSLDVSSDMTSQTTRAGLCEENVYGS